MIKLYCRDMKTLSGGEKSYSTISLVLALWAQIHPPFRILDEFDVFMDNLNRRIALDQIIRYAKVLYLIIAKWRAIFSVRLQFCKNIINLN